MAVHTYRFQVETRGNHDLHNITDDVQQAVGRSGMSDGIATVFVTHTTAAILVGEFESGLLSDISQTLEQIAPSERIYRHNVLNADDNAHSHLAGAIIGPSETVPFESGRLALGTWQRVTLIELDTHPRSRRIIVQVIGV